MFVFQLRQRLSHKPVCDERLPLARVEHCALCMQHRLDTSIKRPHPEPDGGREGGRERNRDRDRDQDRD